jgi:hypothetical protein
MVITSATLLKNLGSGTQSVTQNLAREKRLVVPMPGKKKRFWNTIPVCVLLRDNLWNGVMACSITKLPLVIT